METPALIPTRRYMSTESRPLRLHVYRLGGIWNDDKIVRADDRQTPKYFSKATRLAASWEFGLYAGGPNGVLVCNVQSPYVGPPLIHIEPGPIRLTFGSGSNVVEIHRKNFPDGTHSFRGLDDEVYCWKPTSRVLSNKLNCLNSQDEVVATYRITLFALFKDGELRIHQPALRMADLIVATCLAIRTPNH